MPYARTLQAYTLPEFYAEAPESWQSRLRELSPITDRMPHLRFRWFEPHAHWNHADRGQWVLYSCTPRHLVSADRAAQFATHWSELATEGERIARKSEVSNYQHFLWHTQGVEARPFFILQGNGGTPAHYTRREKRYLDAMGAINTPLPLGFMPACPFDERAVRLVAARDRLFQAGNNIDALEKMDRPEALKAEDELAEKEFRAQFLETWRAIMAPSVEFMQSYLRKSEADVTLPKASRESANAVAQWRDHWIEHGAVLGARAPSSKAVQIAVV